MPEWYVNLLLIRLAVGLGVGGIFVGLAIWMRCKDGNCRRRVIGNSPLEDGEAKRKIRKPRP